MVGSQLSTMSNYMSTPTLIASLSVVANLLIEFMRTSATASVIIPVTIKLADNLSINPLKIIIPMATSCAYAFITPVGTTTNTLIYFHGNLSITEMVYKLIFCPLNLCHNVLDNMLTDSLLSLPLLPTDNPRSDCQDDHHGGDDTEHLPLW